MTRLAEAALAVLVILVAGRAWGQAQLEVDAREAPRRILHARETLTAPAGPLTLLYAKWLPGEHGPTGPIENLAGLRISEAGQPLPWHRDPDNMFAVRVDVPAAGTLLVELDFLEPQDTGEFTSSASSTAELVILSWNQVLLYPLGPAADDWQIAARLRLPEGWSYGTALPVAHEGADGIEFEPVSLTTLIDAPVLAGRHTRVVPLADRPPARIVIAADSEAALAMPEATVAAYRKLVAEAGALFGAQHYRSYTFLLTLSDHVGWFGLEHHESSDNRVAERSLVDEDRRRRMAALLPHEMTHSWNGKYRRPADLGVGSFDKPMRGDLLWVYEGLTEYLGELLAARSGLEAPADHRERLALAAADMEATRGRAWRSLEDTALAAQVLYDASRDWEMWRRGVDFYTEGQLLWLEVDTLLRQKTGGKAGIDDFCRRFHGPPSGPPGVMPYTFDDVVAALNQVAPYDWKGFFAKRVYAVAEHAPMGGIENAGWRLGYGDQPGPELHANEVVHDTVDARFSIGFVVHSKDATVTSLVPGSPAALAGIGPGVQLVGVNGRRYTPERLHEAIRDSKRRPIELLFASGDELRTATLRYDGGERYPRLERVAGRPDLLTPIISPRTK
jgi:predicted metalloprotease with PDZ domain